MPRLTSNENQSNKMNKLNETLYRTERDFRPSSFVIAASAWTAYFACLRLPSKHSFSNIRSTELHGTRRW